jgi:hypothetical protein
MVLLNYGCALSRLRFALLSVNFVADVGEGGGEHGPCAFEPGLALFENRNALGELADFHQLASDLTEQE